MYGRLVDGPTVPVCDLLVAARTVPDCGPIVRAIVPASDLIVPVLAGRTVPDWCRIGRVDPAHGPCGRVTAPVLGLPARATVRV